MDAMDFEIVNILDTKGRISNREIARQLGVTETTVRHRLKRMIEKGQLTISAFIDIEDFQEIYLVVVGVKLNTSPDKCIPKFYEIPSVLSAYSVTGRFDVLITFVVNSRKMLSQVMNEEITSLEEVIDTEAFIVVDNAGLRVPANKLYKLNFPKSNHKKAGE